MIHNILIISVFFVLMLIITVYENWWREVERFNKDAEVRKSAGVKWHIIQGVGLAVSFAFVVQLLVNDYLLTGRILLLLSALWWILSSGWLNVIKRRWFLHQSNTTTNPVEGIGTPIVKLAWLCITILLLILL